MEFINCWLDLKSATRPPLTSPEQMAGELREGVTFTTRTDVDTVVELYERAFVRAFDTYRQHTASAVLYDSLGWGTAEVPTLVAALEYAHAHCRPKDEEGEKGSSHGQSRSSCFQNAMPPACRPISAVATSS